MSADARAMNPRDAGLVPDTEAAIDFLLHLHPDGPWLLTAIHPKGTVESQSFVPTERKEAAEWIERLNRTHGVYYHANLVLKPRQDARGRPIKAEKADVTHATVAHVDLDPKPGHDLAAEQTRILGRLRSHDPPPSIIVFSGGGYQGLWIGAEPIEIGGEVEEAEKFERVNRAIAAKLGGDNCHDVSRLLRLPGTINWPSKKKLTHGRLPAMAVVVEADWERKYRLDEMPKAPPETTAGAGISKLCQTVIKHGHDPENPERWKSRSEAVFYVACEMARVGKTDDEIAAVLLDPDNGISAHVREQGRPRSYAREQAAKARKAVEADFVRTEKGGIVANSQRNIHIAFTRLGVRLTHDSFADRALIEGPEGAPRRYLGDSEWQALLLLIDERFGFRPSVEFFTIFLNVESHRNAFHPVRDYLAGLKWDGTPRLDTWLIEYGGAAASDYVRAIGRLILVAACRRVRQPGCKFDEMVVLQSPQGLDKSTALQTLAVRDEWFTDDLPLDCDAREVIERLAGKWIVEAGELSGMRKVDVEHLKLFLSRRSDKARAAYGRFPKEEGRQCVIFGTTNSEKFLRDTTGNRRYWPVEIERFDVDALCRDRDQLWAEAAQADSAGESIRLAPKLYEEAGEEQEARREEDAWEPLFEDALGDIKGRVLTKDLWEIIDIKAGARRQEHNTRIGQIMKKLGWKSVRERFLPGGRKLRGYARGNEEECARRIYLKRDDKGGWCAGYDPPDRQPGDEDDLPF